MSGQFLTEVQGDPVDVLHQLKRVFENIMIDPLQNITRPGSSLVVNDAVGVINMPATIRPGTKEFSPYLELAGRSKHVMAKFYFHNFIG